MFCLLGLAASGAGQLLAAQHQTKPEVQAPLEIARNVFVIPASPSGDSHRLANIAFVAGPTGVLVWNTGVSHRHGQEILATILDTVNKPVRAALISHAYQDVLFGWSAFAEIGIPVWMHQGSISMMQRRCLGCLERLTETLGPQEMIQTSLTKPDNILTATTTTQLTGQPIEIIDSGMSSGPNDLVMFDPTSGTLFSGPTVMTDELIDMRDGNLDGWLAALDVIEKLAVINLVPDYGSVGTKQAISHTRHYLQSLKEQLAELLNKGVSLADAIELVPMPAFADMRGYDEHHRRNVHRVYLQMESRFFE